MTTTERNDPSQDTCRAQKCPAEVSADEFMCLPHWKMVPAALRAAIQASYPLNVEAMASAEFLAIAQGAIDAVAHKEARTAPRKEADATSTTRKTTSTTAGKNTARRRRKAEQLTLFELSDTP